MPRMSVDDKFRRDPRVLRLAKACGWSRRETMGALIDVWAVNYDRVSEYLDPIEIDLAAELDGFTTKLIESGLARQTKRGVLITGARKRIAYLKSAKQAGRKGGIKSGESRRNSSKRPLKGCLPDPSSKTNPPDLVPDLPSASAVALASEGEGESANDETDAFVELAVRLGPPPLEISISSGWQPEPTPENLQAAAKAEERGVIVEYARRKFVERAGRHGWTKLEINYRWRECLASEFKTPKDIREALTAESRARAAQAARDRERVEQLAMRRCAEADREEALRIAKEALENDFRLQEATDS